MTIFLGVKGPITIDFTGKDATVNKVAYCRLLRQN